jgi:hypothetical protein
VRWIPLLPIVLFACPALADEALAQPQSVTVAGSLQDELGCPGDWNPGCATTSMVLREGGVWRLAATVPAGSWEYRFALDGGWEQNYGLGGDPAGTSIPLQLAVTRGVRFYFRAPAAGGEWALVADSINQRIVTVPGSFQSEIGCPGDWQPDCLLGWAPDRDGDGIHVLRVAIPPGSYEYKFAIDESWDENYGGPGGANLSLQVGGECPRVEFTFLSPDNTGTAHCALDVFHDGFE